MAYKNNKPRVANDHVTNISRHLSRTSSDNFINLFLGLCEEYDVVPLPRLLPLDYSNAQTSSGTAKRKTDNKEAKAGKDTAAPLIYVTHDKSKEENNLEKIECKGGEISVCTLDALSSSIEKFRTIRTIELTNCRINAFGVSQIARILTEIGCVRDLCLDMNPNIRQNYHLLCSTAGNLEYLSLKCCDISDEGLAKIANELKHKEHDDAPRLIGLNVANNRITDVGAGHIAAMLHTNRSLQSLILAGNEITDAGAGLVIQELSMYTLTHDEIVHLRRFNYKRLLTNAAEKSLESISSDSRNSAAQSTRNSSSKKNSKARKITGKILTSDERENPSVPSNRDPIERNVHPFVAESRKIKGEIVAGGNFDLQHLNFSYNHLTDETLKKIIKCLYHQSYVMLKDTSKGLLCVTLEGNDFQSEGNENFNRLNELLSDRVSMRTNDETNKDDAISAPAERKISRGKL